MKKKSAKLRVEELSTPRGNDHWAQKKEAQGHRDGSVGKGACFPAWLLEFDFRTHMWKERTNLPFDLHTCAHTYTHVLHTHKINKYTLKNKTNRKERSPFANIFTYRVISLALKRFSTSPLSPQYWGSNPEPQAR